MASPAFTSFYNEGFRLSKWFSGTIAKRFIEHNGGIRGMCYTIVNTPGDKYLAVVPGEPGIISRRKGKQFYGMMDGKKNHKCKAITFKTEEEAQRFIWNSSALLGDCWHPMPTDARLTKALKPLN